MAAIRRMAWLLLYHPRRLFFDVARNGSDSAVSQNRNKKMTLKQNEIKGTDDKDAILQWVTFRLAGEIYGINVMQVQEVLRYTDIAPVPGSPLYVLGIINLRGNVVTVVDTRQRFGLSPGTITDSTRIVIIESDKHVVGIMVDSVAEVVYMRMSEIENMPNLSSENNAKFIQGVCHRNDQLLILIDLNKFLTQDEWADVESV